MQVRGETLANAAQNAGLFKDLRVGARSLTAQQRAMLASDGKPVDTGAFVSLVRRAVNENWIGTGVMRRAN